MNPNKISAELRRIAAGIRNSKNPSKELVLADIRKVLASIRSAALPPHLQKQVDVMGDAPTMFESEPVLETEGFDDPTAVLEGYMPPGSSSYDLTSVEDVEEPIYLLPKNFHGPGREMDSEVASMDLEDCDGCYKIFKTSMGERESAYILFINKGGEMCCHVSTMQDPRFLRAELCKPCSPSMLSKLVQLERRPSSKDMLYGCGQAVVR